MIEPPAFRYKKQWSVWVTQRHGMVWNLEFHNTSREKNLLQRGCNVFILHDFSRASLVCPIHPSSHPIFRPCPSAFPHVHWPAVKPSSTHSSWKRWTPWPRRWFKTSSRTAESPGGVGARWVPDTKETAPQTSWRIPNAASCLHPNLCTQFNIPKGS